MIKDIIWDFDGTLFDTYPATVNSFIKTLKDYGIDETKDTILDYLKVSENYALTHFKELYGLDDKYIDTYSSYKKDIKPEMVKPFPYAIEVCRQFAALGVRNYIITHRGLSTLKILQYYDMTNYFIEVITKEYGFKRKPDPEAFLYLINKHQIDISTALVIGDRECEILGGKAVGIGTCLYNTNSISFTSSPDFNIDSLNKLFDIIR